MKKPSRKMMLYSTFTVAHNTVDRLNDLSTETLLTKSQIIRLLIEDADIKKIRSMINKRNRK